MANIICGVDVSSETLDCSLGSDGPELQVKSTVEGVAQLARFCIGQGVELVVMEATGGYERLAFSLLWEAGVPCAIANPRQVRRFAEAMGFLEKTDRIDAGVIADYGRAKRLVAQAPASAEQQRLRGLVVRLRQLTELKVSQTNQRRLIRDADVSATFDEILQAIRRQIRSLEGKIAELLGSDPLWIKLDAAFREIKGVADRSVANLLAEVPEIGTLSGKAITKLVGVAPLAQDSGKRSGKRSIRGGRSQVRSLLFVITTVVRRHNDDFAKFHQRLIDAGKPKMVVRIALARKLLVQLNAKARECPQSRRV